MNDVPINMSKVYHNVVILEKGKLFGKVVWRGFPHGRPSEIDTCLRCDSVKSANPAARFCGHCGGEFHGA